MRTSAVLAVGLVAAGLLGVVPPASAASRVSIANDAGGSAIDRTHMTTLRLSGSGFQSVKGGFGGIYVLFGTVSGNWRPSAHGKGQLLYVPDSQSKTNAGYQKFVAFPGDSTAGSANGGQISASGSWSTTLRVPGSTFRATGSDGKVHTVDCAKVTCGVITIGAHGVVNGRNETFTPVRVADVFGGSSGTTTSTTTATTSESSSGSTGATTTTAGTVKASSGRPRLIVDRASAGAGKVLAFTASGLPPGRQVTAVFDDGAAGAGPLTVGADGRLAALITLPVETGPGTHELRLVGAGSVAPVSFAVSPAVQEEAATTAAAPARDWRPIAFAAGAAAVFVGALGFAFTRTWRRRALA